MNRTLVILICSVLGLLSISSASWAGKRGDANVTLRQQTTQSTTANVKVGDVLSAELFVEANGAAFTQVVFFVSFDDQYLEVISTRPAGFPIQPFTAGGWLAGQFFFNDTAGDQIGNSNTNQVPNFQIRYSEYIPRASGGQRTAVGDAVAARFQLRVIRKPPNGVTQVQIMGGFAGGGETGYFVNGDPGSIYNYRLVTPLTVNIQGFKLTSSIPDMYLLPGQQDSLDLDDYVNDPSTPDSTLTWTASLAQPDSVKVTVNNQSHVATVNPNVSSGDFLTNFIGVATVRFTATTKAGESVSDTIRVVVNSPPAFDEAAIPDTVRFLEDTQDTSLVLVVSDPDPNAILSLSSIDPDSTVNTFASIAPNRRVTFTAKKDYFGSENRRFRVVDQYGSADTVQVRVEVQPVNDGPEFIKDFPFVEVGALGQATLNLPEFIKDIDDPFDKLQFTFSGVDSIAFQVSAGNQRLTITPVPPFMGTRTALVVVSDTSRLTAAREISVKVNPPINPQPPTVLVPSLKVGVRAGGGATTVVLDDLVSDLDTPKNQLIWKHSGITRVSINSTALNNRQLSVSAPADSTGFRRTTLTVTDLTALSDALPVRVYSSSLITGVPVAGGMPDLTLIAGTSDSLNLDDYYFDADNTNAQVTWTRSGQKSVVVDIHPTTHRAVFRAPSAVSDPFEEIIFIVTDEDNQTAQDTVRVNLVSAGNVLIDLGQIGARSLARGQRDTINLLQSLRSGNPSKLVWTAQSSNANVAISLNPLKPELVLLGIQTGDAFITVTATDTSNNTTSSGNLDVTVTPGSGTGLQVITTFALKLTAEKDTTLNLSELVVNGVPADVQWSSAGNPNINVTVNQTQKTAVLRPLAGFVGNAGPIEFRATDSLTQEQAVSTATPVEVVGGSQPVEQGLLRVAVVANPILPNFLDVFVLSQRELMSDPFLGMRIGLDVQAKPTAIPVDRVPTVTQEMWSGRVSLDNTVNGIVELSATGITKATRVALTDTFRLEVAEAGIQSTFAIRTGDVAVTLPSKALSKATVVALFPSRPVSAKSTMEAGSLQQISEIYQVYAPQVQVVRPGEIRFDVHGTAARSETAGVYRWDDVGGRWIFAGARKTGSSLVGRFSAFGRYGVFVDEKPPEPGEVEVQRGALWIPILEDGSGVEPASVRVTVDGVVADVVYLEAPGGIRWTPSQVFPGGLQTVRIEVADLAGNHTVWERRLDLSTLVPRADHFLLHQNFPNPFNPETVIRFDAPEAVRVQLTIYNMLGQSVRRLLAEHVSAGLHAVIWDGRDEAGREVAAGTYLYRLDTPEAVLTKKMLLLK
ncbi:MAG: T9SS type A sorting domain-containing protein [bacterium]|nr:T9SS type A sorting domain-containing protein [bacterium]